MHMLSFCEDLGAHYNSRYAYDDKIPKKGRTKAFKRKPHQNEAYKKEINNFRNKALNDCGLPINLPDEFSGGGNTGYMTIYPLDFMPLLY